MNRSTHKVLVIGGTGTLGRKLLADLPGAQGTTRSDNAPFLRLDITDEDQVRRVIGDVRPTCVINTAAMTSVDGCERDTETAQRIHVDGTRHLAEACEAVDSRLIHLSTNYVFDGEDGPYGEEDATNPLSVYGRTKLQSERIVLDGGSGVVVRTAVFYGEEIDRPNFLTWALRELASGRPIRIVTDEWANPTYVPELSAALAALSSPEFHDFGLYHVAGAEYRSRFDMIADLCEVFELDRGLVSPVVSQDLQQAATRPKRAGLKIDKIRAAAHLEFGLYRDNLSDLRSRIGDLSAWADSSRD